MVGAIVLPLAEGPSLTYEPTLATAGLATASMLSKDRREAFFFVANQESRKGMRTMA